MKRRHFLAGTAALALPMPTLATPAPRILRAAPGTASLGGDFPGTAVWAYGDSTPGPVLRVGQGDRLRVRFKNDLPQPSSVHWHGIRIDNTMDGVSGLTQDPVKPGEDFDYDFVVPDAGTYWYHPHNRSWEQMARGLSGALIVEETEPPEVDRDLVLVVDDWRLGEDGQIDEESFGSMQDWSHGGRRGNWPTVNGTYRPVMAVKRHERLRLRIINTCNATLMPLGLTGMEGKIVAFDGQPLAALQDIPARFVRGPGQRVDIIADVIDEATLDFLQGDAEPYPFVSFPVDGEAREIPLGEVQILPRNPLAEDLNMETAVRAKLALLGGAMGGNITARLGGHPMTAMMGHGEPRKVSAEPLSMRELVDEGFVWSMGGFAGMTADPYVDVKRGETVVIAMPNETAWPHAMHIHGHHFRLIEDSKGPVSDAPWRDTILIEPRETAKIAFVADNPGDWMIHCHMLEHQVAGMGTWFRVS